MKEFTDTELALEQWRDIEGYDGMYQVSDLGRVRSKKYGDWRLLMTVDNGKGYFVVRLCKDNNIKQCRVHRLVAHAFIPNTDRSKTIINHIDECKQNNRVSNLEWCTSSYNNTYNNINWRRKNSKRLKIKDIYRPELSSKENIKLFKDKGIDCCERTVWLLRRDLGLSKKYTKRS